MRVKGPSTFSVRFVSVIDSGLVRSHEERRCSILGPTQSRISPIILQYTNNNARVDPSEAEIGVVLKGYLAPEKPRPLRALQ